MSKIKTIIVDDEPKAIAILERYCQDVDTIALVDTFRDPVKAIEFIAHNAVDLIFLDINMPKLSGLEFLDVLKKKPKIIFTTAYSEYAIESYNYEAVDYLLKPIDFPRFMKGVSKVSVLIGAEKASHGPDKKAGASDKTIYIKSGPQLHKVNIGDILYLEKEGNYLLFHTKDKKMLSRQNMKDIFEILDPADFIRVHKSFVIAIDHIDMIEAHQIRIGDSKIPVGRSYRQDVRRIAGHNL